MNTVKFPKYPKLMELSLAELQSMRKLINNGTYDGYSTKYINTQVIECGIYNDFEKWKARLIKRMELINKIDDVIVDKINNIFS